MKIQITQPITLATDLKGIYNGLVSVVFKKTEFALKWNIEDKLFEDNKIIYFDILDNVNLVIRKFAIEYTDLEVKQIGDSLIANETCCITLIEKIHYNLIKSKIIESLDLQITEDSIEIV